MAEDWEKLADDWANSEFAIVAEVDCTMEESQDICQEVGVQGFPTIKYGNPDDLEDYNEGRSYEELSEFAKNNLKPICSPKTVENCDDEMKLKIAELQAKSTDDLVFLAASVEEYIAKTEQKLEEDIEHLQQTYETLMAAFDEEIKKTKSESNYGLIRSILAAKDAEGNDEL